MHIWRKIRICLLKIRVIFKQLRTGLIKMVCNDEDVFDEDIT